MAATGQKGLGSQQEASKQDTIIFDRHGDLRLVVGPGKQECIVCSRSVSRASPVFQRMLYGSFAESKPSKGEWVVSLPEDDAEVLALMLHIVHGQFDKVPLTPSEETMYSIAILTDKYDMAASLRPWATSWLEHLKTNEGGTGDDHGGQRIWIAWELGDADLFEEEATNLLVSSKASLFTAPHRDTPLLETLRTLELIEPLMDARYQVVGSLLGPVRTLFETHLGIGNIPWPTCKVKRRTHLLDEGETCRTVVFGSFVKALITADLNPLPSPDEYENAISTLYDKLKVVASSIHSLETTRRQSLRQPIEGFSWHTPCNPQFKLMGDIENAVYDLPVLVTQMHKTHLDIQAAKTGVLRATEAEEGARRGWRDIFAVVPEIDTQSLDEESDT